VDIHARYAATDASPQVGLNLIYHARPQYFTVPQGVDEFTVSLSTDLPGESVQLKVYDPDDKLVADEFIKGKKTVTVQVSQGASGRPWKLVFQEAKEGVYEDISGLHFSENIPGFVADAPGKLVVAP